jgi:hypothetical protein
MIGITDHSSVLEVELLQLYTRDLHSMKKHFALIIKPNEMLKQLAIEETNEASMKVKFEFSNRV